MPPDYFMHKHTVNAFKTYLDSCGITYDTSDSKVGFKKCLEFEGYYTVQVNYLVNHAFRDFLAKNKPHEISEQQKTDIKDKTRVANAIACLSEIVPENSNVITSEKFKEVGDILHSWRERLHKSSNLTL